jgi:hypothetical protein
MDNAASSLDTCLAISCQILPYLMYSNFHMGIQHLNADLPSLTMHKADVDFLLKQFRNHA